MVRSYPRHEQAVVAFGLEPIHSGESGGRFHRRRLEDDVLGTEMEGGIGRSHLEAECWESPHAVGAAGGTERPSKGGSSGKSSMVIARVLDLL